jgi:hypothetical protein
LILSAAKAACERISADPMNDWTVTVDHGAQGVLGMCDIPKEILSKIRKCDIFLADLTLVGKTDAGKKLPNSNVVFELGYAAKKLGFTPLVGVVNEEFGEIEGQVFDIKRRACLKYNTSKATRQAQLDKTAAMLSKKLEAIFRDTIDKHVREKRNIALSKKSEAVAAQQAAIAERVLKGQFHDVAARPILVTSFFFAPRTHIDYEEVGEAIQPTLRVTAEADFDHYFWRGKATASEFSLKGHLHHAVALDYESTMRRLGPMTTQTPHPQPYFYTQPLVRHAVSDALRMSSLLTRIGIKMPWEIAISLVSASGLTMLDDANQPLPRPFREDMLRLPTIRVTRPAQVADGAATGALLKPALDALMRSAGCKYNWYYPEGGLFNLRIL